MTLDILAHPGGRVLFTHQELACRASGEGRLAPGFADALRRLRLDVNESMVVTSCCRSSAHNRRIGGHPRSLHVFDDPQHPTGGTCAIDVVLRDGIFALKLVGLAERQGWAVGINFKSRFIHLDRRADFGIGPAQLFSY